MSQKYRGFTLIETLITLFISCMLLLLPALTIKTWLIERDIEYVLQSFQKNIIECQQHAILTQKKTRILVNVSNQTVSFHSTAYTDGKIVQHFSDNLIIESAGTDGQISFTASKGNPSAIFSIVITDKFNQRQLKFQSQMGSGRVICYESKI